MSVSIAASKPPALPSEAAYRLTRHAAVALDRARALGAPVLCSITVPAAAGTDPSAVAFASRVAGERWFCFEQPDRDRSALAAVGAALELTAHGRDRFEEVAAAW
ncbi:MAG TPA: isochorismate synthase, partial [Solirubrobacteraceae bacterium]